MGFGWLSRPTNAEREEWAAHPDTYLGGRWRYVDLEAGQTVYIPSGTVHFVFRLPAGNPQGGNTMAYGGHVLRCSQILGWAQCLLAEKRNRNISNEDLSVAAPGYVDQVVDFIEPLLERGDEAALAKWGGKGDVEEFLRLKRQLRRN